MDTQVKNVNLENTLNFKKIPFLSNLNKKESDDYKKKFFIKIKDFYINSSKTIYDFFLIKNDGLKTAYTRSNILDQIISACFKNFFILSPNKIKIDNFGIVATGGYGRRELAPFSDIDILFLHNIKNKKNLENIVKPFLYILWDLGLRVGYATRTLKESIYFSKKNLDISTSILESRFIIGNKKIYNKMKDEYQKKIIDVQGTNFISKKLVERENRLKYHADSRYLLEPNVKDGKGGIRDLQTLSWIGQFFYKANNLNDLVKKKILDKNLARSFFKSKQFFWTVRTHLHNLSNRPNEQLNFEYQKEIAKRMGYKKHKGTTNVERLMKHYFLTAKKVSDLIRIYCTSIEEKEKLIIRKKGITNRTKKRIGDFIIINKRVNFHKHFLIKKNQEKVFKIFQIAQEKDLDIHPLAIRFIINNLIKIDKNISKKKEILNIFIEILTSKKNSEKYLKLMNETGLLGKLIPDFQKIVGQMQFGGFHTFTVDEHTLKAIGLLHDLEKGLLEDTKKLYKEIFSEILSPRILYISLFFHDLGKGRGQNHSVISSKIAQRFCSFLELDNIETKTIIWIIKNHLLMSKVSQRLDLEDSKTIIEFVKQIYSLEQLKLLFLFTIIDMKATGKKVWNSWNKFLLEQLFLKSRKLILATGKETFLPNVNKIKLKLKKKFHYISSNKFENLFNFFPKDLILNNSKKNLYQYFNIVYKSQKDSFISLKKNNYKFATEIIIYTKDEPGLLSKFAGAVAICGFNVVEARVCTLKNSMALDTLWVQNEKGSILDSKYQIPKLKNILKKILLEKVFLEKNIYTTYQHSNEKKLFNMVPQVYVDNIMSEHSTILEINSTDRIGLIYDLTKKIYSLGLQINSAKILTMGHKITDIFYITDLKGKKILSDVKINQLKKQILSLLKN